MYVWSLCGDDFVLAAGTDAALPLQSKKVILLYIVSAVTSGVVFLSFGRYRDGSGDTVRPKANGQGAVPRVSTMGGYMAIRNGVYLAALLALLAGCAQSSNNDDNDDQDQPEESAKNVWSGQVGTIAKAKGVEQTLMQSAQQQGNEIDKQSQ
jgi:hypothetical protein